MFISLFKEGVEEHRKSLAKKLVTLIVSLPLLGGAIWLWGGLPDDLKTKGDFDSGKIWPWLKAGVAEGWEWYINYVTMHPLRALATYILIFFILVFLALTIKYGRSFVFFFIESRKRKILLNQTGLFQYWEQADPDEMADVWNEMSGRILKRPQSTLDIMGANGWMTFGSPNSPLYKAVKEFRGNVRVIMLRPDSDYLEQRAHSVDEDVDVYRSHLTKAIKHLKDLKKKGHHIELRLYNSIPNWKMIFTPRTVWVQHYHNDNHVAECPVYLYYSTDDGNGMYHAFSKDFQRVWDLIGTCEDLTDKKA